jgi:hypothetical protein
VGSGKFIYAAVFEAPPATAGKHWVNDLHFITFVLLSSQKAAGLRGCRTSEKSGGEIDSSTRHSGKCCAGGMIERGARQPRLAQRYSLRARRR